MILNEWLKHNVPNKPLVFLWFYRGVLRTEYKINEQLLHMEVMDCIEEEDCKEVWLR